MVSHIPTKRQMKSLMLVISSDTYPVYAKHREVWRTYMKSHPDIDCWFITCRQSLVVPLRTNDTLFVRGWEGYGAIYGKTIDALTYFLSRTPYSYVIRTNLSSVWDFKALRAYLETQPRERLYAGQIGVHPDTGLSFASGAGILMSADVARTLIANQRIGRRLHMFDDVAIAAALLASGIHPQPLPRVDFISPEHYAEHHDKIPPGSFHFRMKHHADHGGSRSAEPEIMSRLLQDHILLR